MVYLFKMSSTWQFGITLIVLAPEHIKEKHN